MSAAYDMGPDWLMLQALEQQEFELTEILKKVWRREALTREEFNLLKYATGVRAEFE